MIEINNRTRSKIDIRLVNTVAELFMNDHGVLDKNLSLAFVGDKTIRNLNKIYRKKDRATDVLSFEGGGDDLGEVIIDYQQIKRQAKKYRNPIKYELLFILVHGMLHLMGYKDDTIKGKEQMEKKAIKFLEKHNLP